MARKKRPLNPKQEKALAVLAVGQPFERAAAAAGVPARRISDWMRTEAFQEELSRTMERTRKMFESRIFALANNGAPIIQEAMQATRMEFVNGERVMVPDLDRRLEGAKIAVGAAVKLANRYKELQVDGFAPSPQPLVVFPEGTVMPWMNTPVLPPAPIEAEARVLLDDGEPEEQDDDDGDSQP